MIGVKRKRRDDAIVKRLNVILMFFDAVGSAPRLFYFHTYVACAASFSAETCFGLFKKGQFAVVVS